jgi:hypothetical protein
MLLCVMAAASSISPGKRTLLELLVGASLGFLFWSLAGPKMISWWYEPPAQGAISCGPSVDLALSQFVRNELIITVLGALAVVAVMFFIRRALSNRAARNAPPPPAR